MIYILIGTLSNRNHAFVHPLHHGLKPSWHQGCIGSFPKSTGKLLQPQVAKGAEGIALEHQPWGGNINKLAYESKAIHILVPQIDIILNIYPSLNVGKDNQVTF